METLSSRSDRRCARGSGVSRSCGSLSSGTLRPTRGGSPSASALRRISCAANQRVLDFEAALTKNRCAVHAIFPVLE